ncbi:hypothetical protein [Jidongwangia harbinensis]|uniref:hypothetical protein n=1 Tax=Jidongwangia harbinensis TaxID=2878561 RepID=UPI001CDA3548|nr:hypothetical protein [Jidongwangia harbinensis]MCA2211497.1 hypothetical protein [Jidongwangia harbinensis]
MDPSRGARADTLFTVAAVTAAVLVVPWTAGWSAQRTHPEDVGTGSAECFPIVVLLDEPAGPPPATGAGPGAPAPGRIGSILVCGR